MSSILEALKKLERDKANGRAHEDDAPDLPDLPTDREILSRGHDRDEGQAIRISSTAVIAGALTFGLVLVGASVATSLIIARASAPASVVAAASLPKSAPAPANATAGKPSVAPEAPSTTPRPVQVASVAPTIQAPAPSASNVAPPVAKPIEAPVAPEMAIVVETPVAAPVTPPAPVAEEPAKEVVTEEPVKAPVPKKREVQTKAVVPALESEAPSKLEPAEAQPIVVAKSPPPALPKTEQQAVSTSPADAASGEKIDMNSLPMLSETERIRLGLPVLKINILGVPNKRQPRPSALINYEKVYVGENIGSTNARLISVDVNGIAIDVGGARYFLENRR